MFRKKVVIGLVVAGLLILTLFVFRNNVGAPGDWLQSSDDTTPADAAAFNTSKHPTDKAESIWVIANKTHPLKPIDYAPTDLVAVGANSQRLRQEAATALNNMFTAATAAGVPLQALSGYRSYATQQTVYAREVAANGQAVADSQSAKPGHSEHQTGLAMDLGGGGCGIEDCFGNTAQGKWVATHAHEYGFIIRYVPGKDAVTGYRPEPWHVRYVGPELAAELKNKNTQTLEEFFGL